jgi:hypothetical protein
MKVIVPTIGPNTNFKQWKIDFLTFMSLKVACLIPQLAIRESGGWFDETRIPMRMPFYCTLPWKISAPTKQSSASLLLAMIAPLQLGTF